jgi:hypothetical protein
VVITNKLDPYGKGPLAMTAMPTFSYRVLAGWAPVPQPDPATGMLKPAATVTKTYRLEGSICRRILPPGVPPPDEAHPEPVADKKKKR